MTPARSPAARPFRARSSAAVLTGAGLVAGRAWSQRPAWSSRPVRPDRGGPASGRLWPRPAARQGDGGDRHASRPTASPAPWTRRETLSRRHEGRDPARRDRTLEARVDRFAATARTLFRTVEGDPRDLTAARKYIWRVYLMGARDATVKFADLYAQTRDAKARADYEALLTDLETTFRRTARRRFCPTTTPILMSKSRCCATG